MPQPDTLSQRLDSLLGALSTPWEFASIDAWRDHIARSARDAVGGQHSQVSLDPACGLAPLRSPDVDPVLIAEYQRDWITRDPFAEFLTARGITSYVRSTVAARFPAFGAEYNASPILNEFYRRAGLHDAAGVMRRHPRFAQLTVFTTQRTNPRFVRRARRLMPLVAPAFLDSAQQIVNVAAVRGHFARNIDALRVAVALYDTAGRLVHRNTALQALLATDAEAPASLTPVLDRAAHALAAIARSHDPGQQLALMAGGATSWRWREATVAGSIARLGIDGSPPLIMLQVLPGAAGDVLSPPVSPAPASHTLSVREMEVAECLARGVSNRTIAANLGVTEHTARRHTEHVLRKLGLTSRAGVARALGLLRRHDTPTS